LKANMRLSINDI